MLKLLILFAVSFIVGFVFWRRDAFLALFRRWKHCLLRPCRSINLEDREDRVIIRACDCGMVWWTNVEDYQDTELWRDYAGIDSPPRDENPGPGAMKIHSSSRRSDR